MNVSRLSSKVEPCGCAAGNILKLRMYVADKAPTSVQALDNLEAICQACLAPDEYELEIVDVFAEPLRALEDGVLVTPTLIVAGPQPAAIVGSLSERERVIQVLGLHGRVDGETGRA
jgi:circadian clock protein KaiB